MVQTRQSGSMVGVSRGLDVALFTVRDSTEVTKPADLAALLILADEFARRAGAATVRKIRTA